jgi:hypothetical protein
MLDDVAITQQDSVWSWVDQIVDTRVRRERVL